MVQGSPRRRREARREAQVAKRREQGFRITKALQHEGVVVALILGSMVVLLGAVIVTAVVITSDGDPIPGWLLYGGTIGAITGPLTVAAVIGFGTISRWGAVMGLALGAGFTLAVWGGVDDDGLLSAIGWTLLGLVVVGAYTAGWRRGVPMSLGGLRFRRRPRPDEPPR